MRPSDPCLMADYGFPRWRLVAAMAGIAHQPVPTMTSLQMINLTSLIDDAKCYELIRHYRWPDGVRCTSCSSAQPSPHFSHSKINALPLNGQQTVTAITALWLWRSTAFRWLQQPIGRHLMIDVVEQVIERHPEVKNERIPEIRHP